MSTATYQPKRNTNSALNPSPDSPPPITTAQSHYEAAIKHEETANMHRQTAKLFEQNKIDAVSHYQAAIKHEATAKLHRQSAKLFEQNKMDEAKKIEGDIVKSNDGANKQSTVACQITSSNKPQ